MKRPTLDDVRSASHRLSGVVAHTGLVPLHDYQAAQRILLKLEIHQPVTSFKIRGIYNAVACLSDAQRQAGLSTVSAGNTAQALAYTARCFGTTARSVMPDTAPKTKIDAVKSYGGTPVLVPTEQVFRFLQQRLWESEPYWFIHPWINRDVMIGHGTLALEIIADCPEVDSVYVPVGGGGLIAGVGSAIKALKPSVRLVAVEPAGCPSLHESMRQGKAATVPCKTICDGVWVPYMTEEMFPLLQSLVDEVVLVSDEDVCSMMRRLAAGNKIIVEPSAALAAAAACSTPQPRRGVAVCLVTGGSIDLSKFAQILAAT